MNKEIIVTAIFFTFLSGCAGSASHKVVSAHTAGDDSLSCQQLDSEILKTQVVIDDVNKDKDDVSGADIVDGILYFPFNLIAKSSNYKNALEAADGRIDNLQVLKKDKRCQVGSEPERQAAASKLSSELKELNELYKSGVLTEDEYMKAKQKTLNSVDS